MPAPLGTQRSSRESAAVEPTNFLSYDACGQTLTWVVVYHCASYAGIGHSFRIGPQISRWSLERSHPTRCATVGSNRTTPAPRTETHTLVVDPSLHRSIDFPRVVKNPAASPPSNSKVLSSSRVRLLHASDRPPPKPLLFPTRQVHV